jgi:hypothetical protein
MVVPLGLARVDKLTPTRKEKIYKAYRVFPEREEWVQICEEFQYSLFLQNRKNTNGHMRKDFDWLLNNGKDGTENYIKLPGDPEPGEQPIAEFINSDTYQGLLKRLGKGDEPDNPSTSVYKRTHGKGSVYDAKDPSVPGSENRPHRRLRVVQLPGDPLRPLAAEPDAVPAEPDGGDPAERDADHPASVAGEPDAGVLTDQ